jgi:transcriptional regulatory protein RtcR
MPQTSSSDLELLEGHDLGEMDLFDRLQLAQVVRICRESLSISEAGRKLFGVSRGLRTSKNDADRLRKYLLRFHLDWPQIERGKART